MPRHHLPDHAVREIRALYAEHQRAKEEKREPSLAIKDIAKLFAIHWTTVIRIGRREQRHDVPDEPPREDEGRTPRQPHPRTLKRRSQR